MINKISFLDKSDLDQINLRKSRKQLIWDWKMLSWNGKRPKTGGRIFRFHLIEQIPKNRCIWNGFPVLNMVGLIAI
jgi:hypothetical protein